MIPFDVEDGKLSDAIRSREIVAHIIKASPLRPFCQSKPDIQWSGETRVLRAGFQQLSASDDMQSIRPQRLYDIRKMRNRRIVYFFARL